MKSSVLFSILFFFSVTTFSQEFKIPENYKFEKKEDYRKYEADIINAIEYLENSKLNDNSEHRKKTNAFLLQYLTGSSDIKIMLRSYVMEFSEKNKDFLMIFMGGWAKYAINNEYDTDEFKGSLAGLKSVMKVYEMGEGIKKDRKVEKLIELSSEGKLEDWLKTQIVE